ncbi:MAG TPA: hypothetical protein VLA48_03520 [Nitrososphaeraceae archaeon]|nr:hypothetical protein [Nitrososphaeraceae archaeon]
MKYSLFVIEKKIETAYTVIGTYLSESCFEYLGTFDTLEAVQKDQKEYDFETIILSSY